MSDPETMLLRLLRCELTAVNQQFSHILSLRAGGDTETAARIAEIDDVDFPNAMRIADYLIREGIPVRLGGDRYMPGCARQAVLLAEQDMERRMAEALDNVVPADAMQERLVATARAPRTAYGVWLADELEKNAESGPAVERPVPEIDELVAHLLASLELSMIHALMHRQAGDNDAADGSWATSGAAMMHMTHLVRFFAREDVTPAPGRYPPIRIAETSDAAPDFEQALADQCATAALKAEAAVESPQLATLCDGIAYSCEELTEWRPGRPHPALQTNPPAFMSFERTYNTYVSSG